MSRELRIAVLGAGIMGSTLALHPQNSAKRTTTTILGIVCYHVANGCRSMDSRPSAQEPQMEYLISLVIALAIIYILRRFGAKSGHSNDLDD